MRDRYRYQRKSSMGMGVVAVAVGILFLFYQGGAFPEGFRLDFWAVVLMAGGLAQFVTTCEDRDRIWGAGLIVVGALMQTNAMGYTHLHLRNVWPLFIILLGISMLWHSVKNDRSNGIFKVGVFHRNAEGEEVAEGLPENPEINMDFVLGGGEPRVESKNFRGGRINAMLGGFKLDLTHADIEGTEAVLFVNTLLGGGEIVVPETWLVEMHGSAVLGGYDNKTRYFQPDTTKPPKRLIIRGNAILGGIEVKN